MKNISLNEIENEIRSLVDEHIKDETIKYRPNDPKGYNFEIGLFLDKREGIGTGYNWYNYTYYKIS